MSKALSEKIVDKCIENPKVAFLLVPLGLALIYWGVTDAQYYRRLSTRPTQVITEASIVPKENNRGFIIPHVVGKSAEKEVSIPISAKTARTLEIGNEMEVIETDENSGEYLLKSAVDSQVSSIYFEPAGIPVNFITILGLAIAGGAIGWGCFAKPKSPTPAG